MGQKPGNELKDSNIVSSFLDALRIHGVSREVEACHSQSRFVGSIVEERVAVHHHSHADYGFMPLQGLLVSEGKRKGSWNHQHLLPMLASQVQIASEIEITIS